MHVGRAIARARKAIAETDVALLGAAVEAREVHDLGLGEARDASRPGGVTRAQMLPQLAREVGVFREVVEVGEAVAEQHMHHGAGERAIGAGPEREMPVGDRGGARAVGVDHHEGRATLLSCAAHMVHDIDLRGGRVAAPHDNEIRFRHLARVGPDESAGAGKPAGVCERGADRVLLAGIAHHMAQAVDAVALHQAHRAGVVIGPHGLRAVLRGRALKTFGNDVERVVPGDALEPAAALRADAP